MPLHADVERLLRIFERFDDKHVLVVQPFHRVLQILMGAVKQFVGPVIGPAGVGMKRLALEAAVFGRSTYLQYVALFQWANPQGYVAYKVLLPVTQILFFVELGVYATGPQNALYFALGNALQLTANAGIFGVIATVANERQYGTLPILLASPDNRMVTFLSRAMVNVIDGIATVDTLPRFDLWLSAGLAFGG